MNRSAWCSVHKFLYIVLVTAPRKYFLTFYDDMTRHLKDIQGTEEKYYRRNYWVEGKQNEDTDAIVLSIVYRKMDLGFTAASFRRLHRSGWRLNTVRTQKLGIKTKINIELTLLNARCSSPTSFERWKVVIAVLESTCYHLIANTEAGASTRLMLWCLVSQVLCRYEIPWLTDLAT